MKRAQVLSDDELVVMICLLLIYARIVHTYSKLNSSSSYCCNLFISKKSVLLI